MAPGGTTFAVIALTVLAAGPVDAKAADKKLEVGAYQVKVDLDLPNVENTGAKKTTTLCVTPEETYGLAVLSDNNPLANCPVTNIRQSGDRLTFEIICEGPNAARASASYRLEAERFRGRIAMNMGGKNMTMTETQSGHRVGECDPVKRPRRTMPSR